MQKRPSLSKKHIVIIGAGPAGLSAAIELTKDQGSKKFDITILEKNDKVGGLARTVNFQGGRFDVGPHRFYTKNKEVLDLWKKTLGKDFTKVKRLTRMLYRDKFFLYPIALMDVATKLSPIELVEVLFSFISAKLFLRNMQPVSFEDYITKNFGRKMFSIFFKTYTEKIWGISCKDIAAKWASQRIKNLNLWEIIKNSLNSTSEKSAKSLVDEFYYPSLGSGLMYETMAKNLTKLGVKILLNAEVLDIKTSRNKITSISYKRSGKVMKLAVDNVLSSMPITSLVASLRPVAPRRVLSSAKRMIFRDHITVNLTVSSNCPFPDNWIYIHDPNVQMARVTNYNTMSSNMSKNKNLSSISVEYFAFRSENIWKMSDEKLIDLAKLELNQVKLVAPESIVAGFVIRELDSYPVYYTGHEQYFEDVKKFVSEISNLELVGRGGMFKYNNMDHSIYSGMLGARNISLGYRKYQTWSVNEDAEYLEEQK